MKMARIIYLFIFLLLCTGLMSQTSPFSTGKWAKIAANKQGIYKLTGAHLRTLGFSLPIASSQMQLFNFKLGQLSDKVPGIPPKGIIENAIKVMDGGDGQLDETDYILFYNEGVVHSNSDSVFYYVTLGTNGKRIGIQNTLTNVIDTKEKFNQHFIFEKDTISFLNSGKTIWGYPMGQGIGKQSQLSVTVNTQGMSGLDVLKCNVHMASTSYQSNGRFDFLWNEQPAHSSELLPVTGMLFDDVATDMIDSFLSPNITSWPNKSVLKINYSSSNSSATGWLDYVEVHAKKNIGFWQDSTLAFGIEDEFIKGAIYNCKIQNLDTTTILWNVTYPENPLFVNIQFGTNGVGSFFQKTDATQQFFGLRQYAYETPILVGSIPNQNAMGESVSANYIIVAAPAYMDAAKKYQQFQISKFGRSVIVANAKEIYNEFSGGQPSAIAIRNYIKYLYNKAVANDKNLPEYLLLLGMGNFNSKKMNLNFELPVYESYNSTSILSSYTTDDFFAVLNDDADINNVSSIRQLSLAVGRIPARTVQEADTAVNKLIAYQNNRIGGAWANKITWIADDGDYNLHLQDAEAILANLQTKESHWDYKKVYLDLYPAVASTSGSTYPLANNAIKQTANDGTLIMNYTGHGNYLRLSEEAVISQEQFASWNNAAHLPLMVTASCNFAPYDQPNLNPIAWDAFMKNGNGIIGLVAANRLVFAYSNKQINDEFVQQLLVADSSGNYRSIGKALQRAKINNWSNGGDRINALKFSLLGDPAMQLQVPNNKLLVKQINSKAFKGNDTLLSGNKYTIQGQVQKGILVNTDFNGIADLTIYDAVKFSKTLANYAASIAVPIAMQENILFKGKATVSKGIFGIDFILPSQVSNATSPIRIELAAVSDSNSAIQVLDSIYVKSNSVVNFSDTIGPKMNAYLNDSLFKTGAWAAPNSTLYITLQDSSGIQTSGNALGHDLSIWLDNNPVPIIINNYFVADINTYQTGKVQYALPTLSEGVHICIVKAWDLLGNGSVDTIRFEVPKSNQLQIKNAFNFPNPFKEQTRFCFETNQVGKEIEINLDIINSNGQVLYNKTSKIVNALNKVFIDWDGVISSGSKLQAGSYYYRIALKTSTTTTFLSNTFIKL